jgi:hypothetical protein
MTDSTLAASITLALFSVFNMLRVVSYLPQILKVARDVEGAKAISYVTWALWIAANASTALYAHVNLGDPTLCVINAANAACCGIVLALTVWKRRQFLDQSAPNARARP